MQNTFGPHLQNLMITSQNSSSAVPRSITGCFVTQNIGEVARSDGVISSKKNPICLFLPPLFVSTAPLSLLYTASQHKGEWESLLVLPAKLHDKRVSQNSSPAVSRSITGCFATQNIGEVARSDGGVSSKKILVKIIYLMKKIGSFLLPTFSFVEKKQRQSTSHLMCAASQNARRVLRF